MGSDALADGGDHARRAARALLVDLAMPVGELREQIRLVVEAPLLEERPLHEADEMFDRSLLPGHGGPAEFDADAEYVSSTVFYSTLLSSVTLTLLLAYLGA